MYFFYLSIALVCLISLLNNKENSNQYKLIDDKLRKFMDLKVDLKVIKAENNDISTAVSAVIY